MELSDLSKDLRRLLLEHWTRDELNSRLGDPEYFFDQIVTPHLNYLRRSNEDVPRVRLQKKPTGEFYALLL